jgi:hypothetical protein
LNTTRSAIVADADLTIRAGTAEGRLSGSGSRLTFETSRLTPFLTAMPNESDRGWRIASRALASSGVSVSVVESGVAVLDIGDVRTSILARVIGLRHVRIRHPFRLLARYLRR